MAGSRRRLAGLFVDALGDGREDTGRVRIEVMAASVAVMLVVASGIAAWPAIRSATRSPSTGTAAAPRSPATPPLAAGQPAQPPAQGPAAPVLPAAPAPVVAAPPGFPAEALALPATARQATLATPPAAVPTPPPTAAPAAAPAPGFSFEDGGTDGWGGHGHVSSLGNSGTVAREGSRSLQAVLHSTSGSDLPYVSVSVSGSSAPAAGQTLTAFVLVSGSATAVQGKLFVQDTSFTWHMSSLAGLRQGGWTQLSLAVPAGIHVNQLGVQFLCTTVNQNATVFVDSVHWG